MKNWIKLNYLKICIFLLVLWISWLFRYQHTGSQIYLDRWKGHVVDVFGREAYDLSDVDVHEYQNHENDLPDYSFGTGMFDDLIPKEDNSSINGKKSE